MDPNQPIIDLMLDHFPGNDIFFDDYNDYIYNVRVNYRDKIQISKSYFDVKIYDKNIISITEKLAGTFLNYCDRGKLINLHPKMCKKIDIIPVKCVSTIIGNEIDKSKPVYVIAYLREETPVLGNLMTTQTISIGLIQEVEMLQFYPYILNYGRDNLIMTKKR